LGPEYPELLPVATSGKLTPKEVELLAVAKVI
jgi:hypothetical protein